MRLASATSCHSRRRLDSLSFLFVGGVPGQRFLCVFLHWGNLMISFRAWRGFYLFFVIYLSILDR
ncbi:hypothetical protein F4860DRAFT_480619 [Xylaria cubensis]|nr:hypothetical protein F4860DRAFT_480619 [Xylaria cubensis]